MLKCLGKLLTQVIKNLEILVVGRWVLGIAGLTRRAITIGQVLRLLSLSLTLETLISRSLGVGVRRLKLNLDVRAEATSHRVMATATTSNPGARAAPASVIASIKVPFVAPGVVRVLT